MNDGLPDHPGPYEYFVILHGLAIPTSFLSGLC